MFLPPQFCFCFNASKRLVIYKVIRKYNSLAAELLASKEILLLFGSFKSNIEPSALSFFFSFVYFFLFCFFWGGGGGGGHIKLLYFFGNRWSTAYEFSYFSHILIQSFILLVSQGDECKFSHDTVPLTKSMVYSFDLCFLEMLIAAFYLSKLFHVVFADYSRLISYGCNQSI